MMDKTAIRITTALAAVLMLTSVACDRGQRSYDFNAGTGGSNASIQAAPNTSDDQDSRPKAGESSEDGDTPSFYYSPFVVHLDAPQFDTVSFKDVGLDRKEPTPHDPLLETISQAFVYEVSNHTDLDYEGEVVYDERILDPANHLYCGERHLYIDVWRSESPKRWGYSMWSGCGEGDNFAWEEVEVQPVENMALTDEVSPLAESIADRLAEASDSNCFTKNC